MSPWQDWMADGRRSRESAGLNRAMRPRPADDGLLDLAGNDYLGLGQNPTVRQAAADAATSWGAGAGASRLVSGTLTLHEQLEDELAEYLQQPAALVLSTGYHANLSLVTALADRTTRVLSDAHVHASLIDAVRMSRAQVEVVAHQDVAAVGAGLVAARRAGERALVLVESVYSVLGDAAPLAALAGLCEEHDALLVVDEAHGIGVHGPGLVATAGLAGLDHVVVTATLSKALGAQGGAVLGSHLLREHLVNRARPFIFDTALAPASTAGALAALREIRARPELGALVRRRRDELADALGVPAPVGAVLSVPLPTPQAAVAGQVAANDAGVRVGCFRPPSVPDGISRLRITVNAALSESQWTRAVDVLLTVVGEHR
jgi:8-amino-7-oxononanoate synthase